MTISAAATPVPIGEFNARVPFVTRDGFLTTEALLFLAALRAQNLGGNRIIPCNATGTNVISLAPLAASPKIDGYRDHDIFAFVAANNSTGSVTGTVVPMSGTLATIKFFKTNGAAQAGSGDVVANSLYLGVFNDALDSGAGGLVLK